MISIDVRDTRIFEKDFIKGSINIPMNEEFIYWFYTVTDDKKPVRIIQEREKISQTKVFLSKQKLDVNAIVAFEDIASVAAHDYIFSFDPYEFQFLYESGNYTMLDMRRRNELKYKFQGSQNLPLEELQNEMPLLDKSQQYLVYCVNGHRSTIACSILKTAGFSNVYNLEKGIEEAKILLPKTLQYC